MTKTKISELLSIPRSFDEISVDPPNPYQLFGLPVGESDEAKLANTVSEAIQRLHSIKSQSDLNTWTRAVGWVKDGGRILLDPEKKRELDSRLGISSTDDPLIAYLPKSNPLRMLGPVVPAPVRTDEPLVPKPAVNRMTGSPELVSAVQERPFDSGSGTSLRRRKSPIGMIGFAVTTVALLAVVGSLAWVLFDRSPPIANANGDAFELQGSNENPTPPPAFDPVFHAPPNWAASKPDSVPEDAGTQPSPLDIDPAPIALEQPESPMQAMAMPEEEKPNQESPAMMATDEPESMLSPEMIAEMDIAIGRTSAAIRNTDWQQMSAFAKKSAEMPGTDQQLRTAESLYEIVDLANHYREGIRRGIETLNTGSDFEIDFGVRVIVVEASPERLVVRLNAKTHRYLFDQIPLLLAHRLSTFAMPSDSPSTIAAKAAFEAISKNATPEHRQRSLKILESINKEIPGADPKLVAEGLRRLYE